MVLGLHYLFQISSTIIYPKIGNTDSIEDVFVVSYELGYHHFTLYYYDRAGSLVRTVPPEGVAGGSAANRKQTPNHTLTTEYAYNSLRQLVRQKTPDGGETHFWYDKLGQLRFSQNEKQLTQNRYSYTKYDSLGRIIETGESREAGLSQGFSAFTEDPDFPSDPAQKGDQTHTLYTEKAWDRDFGHRVRYPEFSGQTPDGREQTHLRNRVSEVVAIQDGDTVKTVYSYDIHGNVEWMMQDVPELRRTYLRYEYDLVSGNVTKVAYNDHPSRIDRFYHRYNYDADNRITRVETSRDGIIWDTDARYDYYAHGPLERTEIGHDKLQGTDYVYNLHGWLKAMNHPTLTVANDPGSDDGQPGNFGADEWGMQLNYYNGDFDRSGSPFSSSHSSYLAPERELFNGNISAWASHIAHREGTLEYEQLTGYKFRYDELNRLTRSNFHFHTLNLAWLSTPDYDADYSYDANGNILTLNRNAHTALVLGMDELTYNYYPGTNQLEYVEDDVPDGNYNVDIDNQQADNYLYDATGNLIKDVAEGIDTILWTAEGKVKEVRKDNGDTLLFLYDGNGNRVMKEYRTATDTIVTYYTRDTEGNAIAIHKRTRPDSMYEYRIKELPVYGSDRIGVYKPDLLYKRQAPEDCEGCCCCILSACYNKDMNWHNGKYTRNLGKRAYQIDDHLSNVRVTFSDVKHSTLDVNGLPDSVFADVISYSNYYGFGMLAVDRHVNVDSFRFGFNSKEMDNEWSGKGNVYDYGFRIYNPRLGKFLSVDPKVEKYPYLSAYAALGNNPIVIVDINGEEIKVERVEREGKKPLLNLTFTADVINTSNTDLSEEKLLNMSEAIGAQIQESFGKEFEDFEVKVKTEFSVVDDFIDISDNHLIRFEDPTHEEFKATGKKGKVGGAASILGTTAFINTDIVDDVDQLKRTGAHEFGHLAGLPHAGPGSGGEGPEVFVILDPLNLMHQTIKKDDKIITGTNIEQKQVEEIERNFGGQTETNDDEN